MSLMNADGESNDPQTYAIIGAAMKVHKQLGHGFLEAVYQEALEIEFTKQGIPFQRELELQVYYNDQPLKQRYRSDFLCYDSIVVELKALSAPLSGNELCQILHYLKATRLSKGLLLNFGRSRLEYKRQIFTHQ